MNTAGAEATSAKVTAGDPEAALSPAMRQYRAAKEAYPDALLLFRMGDFYELFFEDAIVAARELQLTLTARDKLRAVPMCGVPYHAAEVYVQRLLRRGFRVALCEQMEDPKLAKGVVRREVTRVLTPGTAIDPALGAEQSNWLAALAVVGAQPQMCAGVALLDLSTGEFRATEFAGAQALAMAADELERLRPAELLYSPRLMGSAQERAAAPSTGRLRFAGVDGGGGAGRAGGAGRGADEDGDGGVGVHGRARAAAAAAADGGAGAGRAGSEADMRRRRSRRGRWSSICGGRSRGGLSTWMGCGFTSGRRRWSWTR